MSRGRDRKLTWRQTRSLRYPVHKFWVAKSASKHYTFTQQAVWLKFSLGHGEHQNRGCTPLGHETKPHSMNHRPISFLINFRHVTSQNKSFATLASATGFLSPATSRRVIIFQSFLKNLSRSLTKTLRPYPAPVGLGCPLLHTVAWKFFRLIDELISRRLKRQRPKQGSLGKSWQLCRLYAPLCRSNK